MDIKSYKYLDIRKYCKLKGMDEQSTRHITDLYFFEELRKSVGIEASREWFVNVDSTIFVGQMAPQTAQRGIPDRKAAACSINGRDRPRAKESSSKTRSGSAETSGISEDGCDSVELKETFCDDDRNSKSDLKNSVRSQPAEAESFKFKKTPSFEKKFGLLFTDAAHTILE